MASKQQIKDMADRLISTLDTLMPSERADAIVRDVAEELYNNVLGIQGNIVVDRSQPTGHFHASKKMHPIAKYKFEVKQ